MEPAQFSHNGLPRRLQQPELVTTVRGVWQDNPAPNPAPSATPQPAPPQKVTRTVPKEGDTNSPQHRNTRQRKDVQLNLWVRPGVKAELQRVASREGLSISSAGEALLEKALQQDMHTQHAALLDPIIEKAIGKHMRSYSSRIAILLVRSLFASEQTRSIVTNILSRQPTVTQPILTEILNGSSSAAKRNITHVTPQLATLLKEVEQWMREEGKPND